MTSQHHEIDESLYSRQLYVMGHEAQKRMASSNVLIVGLNGLGVEVAKNVILAGVKSVLLYDQKVTTYSDLASQFYLTESDLNKNRAAISFPKLAELNPYVHVGLVSGSVFDAIKSNDIKVVVLIDQNLSTQKELSEYCHNNNIAIVIGDVRGVFGNIFCDFGENFVVHDSDGETAASSLIAGITNDTKALITVLDDSRHNLNTGDVVTLSDISGMEELNGQQFRVEVKDPFSFEIEQDTRGYHNYIRGGYINQIKQPQMISFKSFLNTLYAPGMFVGDFVKFDKFPVLHYCFLTLQEFESQHGRFPAPGNMSDAETFYQLLLHIQSSIENNGDNLILAASDLELNKEYILKFALCSTGQISPVCALVGGIMGQEVLKACSGKFMPIRQWFYYDAAEVMPDGLLSAEEVSPLNCRYDAQIAIFGKSIQQQLSKLQMFLVGAGAIGCEMLKNWALMGVSSSFLVSEETGQIYVTDMDQIEKSNLSRQFLFRNSDINKPKSTTAIRAVTTMNPGIKAMAFEQKVAPETENFFNDDFFEPLDMICTALDNVEARLYIDQKCVFYRKPMLESGTLGTKGHTQIVSPGQTENYGATRDPPEKSIPVCTLKHFPNQIEHTLQWARDWFEEIFKQAVDDMDQYLTNAGFLEQLNQPNLKLETLKRLKASLIDQRPSNFEDCVVWARKTFEDLFNNRIKQLLYNFPLDRVSANGTLFWSGGKKPPASVEFDSKDPLHIEFIVAAAQMRAKVYNIEVPGAIDLPTVATIADRTIVEVFCPQTGVKIAATDEEAKADQENNKVNEMNSDIDTLCADLQNQLPSPEVLRSQLKVQSIDFDKDIDSHMRVVASVSNLRARNYRIPEADLHTSRGIAGKITPAIATTTALVTGLICMELYKLLQKKPVTKLMNTFSNLAIPLFTSMEPEPPKSTTALLKDGKEWKWTQWDRIDITNPNMTVEQLIDFLTEEYGVELSMLSSGVTILFSNFMDRKKKVERSKMNLKTLVETVTKKTIPDNQKYLIFELMVNSEETGDDVDLPYLRYRL